MKCSMYNWTGHPDSMVAIADEPESINDYVHCPICNSNVWAELSDKENDTMNAEHENFYISPELSEVIDLAIKRQGLLMALGAGADESIEEEYIRVTDRLEKLTVKEKFVTKKDLQA